MDEMVAQVRRFNRALTQDVGALHDRYLSRGRPLGAARVLWEIGDGGCDVRRLRARLGLDSGYLSRLLRSLEDDGLITVVPADHDKRVRTARLTKKGITERRVLDRRSDALARSMLTPLDTRQQQRLVQAMSDVERLLDAAMVQIDVVDPGSALARHCLTQYFCELDQRFDTGFDPDRSLPAQLDDMRPPAGVFVVATLRGEPVGCGALKFHTNAPTELKRMWVAPSARGIGLGRRLLTELEARAADNGSTIVRLETNRSLTEAIGLYRSCGYEEVPPFNNEAYAHHWFQKQLAPTRSEQRRRA